MEFADRPKRDAADDRIVELVEEMFAARPELTVVTSDKGLMARLPPGVKVTPFRQLPCQCPCVTSEERGQRNLSMSCDTREGP